METLIQKKLESYDTQNYDFSLEKGSEFSFFFSLVHEFKIVFQFIIVI